MGLEAPGAWGVLRLGPVREVYEIVKSANVPMAVQENYDAGGTFHDMLYGYCTSSFEIRIFPPQTIATCLFMYYINSAWVNHID